MRNTVTEAICSLCVNLVHFVEGMHTIYQNFRSQYNQCPGSDSQIQSSATKAGLRSAPRRHEVTRSFISRKT